MCYIHKIGMFFIKLNVKYSLKICKYKKKTVYPCVMGKTLREIFIENLRYYRQKKGLSQLELAVEIEKSPNYINGIENNSTFPSVETIEKIATALGISAKQLFDENGCVGNILPSGKQQFIDDIAKRLSASLEKDIRREMEDVLGK